MKIFISISGTKLFAKAHWGFRRPGFKVQTNQYCYIYDPGHISSSLWTRISLWKNKKEWLDFAIS